MHAHLFVHATDSRLIASKNRSQRHPSRLRQECKLTSFLPFQFLDHTGIRGSNGSALASIWVIERVDHQRSAGRVRFRHSMADASPLACFRTSSLPRLPG